jgi:PAS domain S-box-containing protein
MTRRVGYRVDLHSVPAGAGATGDGDGLAAVSPQAVGWFRFYFDDRRWEWSEQVQRLHGYEPGTVSPTTELVLSHKHPDDRDRVAATIDDIMHTRGALSSRHRIIDTDGAVHWVVVIGDQFLDGRGVAIGTHGFYVDITPIQRSREDTITARLGEITDKRAPIEQVKGMLMLVYDLDDDAAIDLLKWLSQESNVKLRVLAERISTTLRATARGAIVGRTIFDHALITAHRFSDCDETIRADSRSTSQATLADT